MKTLLSKEELHDGVARMAVEIEQAFEGRQLTIVGVLTGSVVLVADLIRLIHQPMRVGVIQASSYRGATTTRGDLVINSELMLDISGRDVLLVDDMLRKQGRQESTYEPDFTAFDIPDEFVVGYGLDYEDMYRNLPYLAALESEDLEKHRSL
jgi:hypoxanthine phosphoribosyltransferase